MDRMLVLREQAKILRALAETFDTPRIQDQLLAIAKRCDALAASVEDEHQDELEDSMPPPSAKR
jgi:hypothetical protein